MRTDQILERAKALLAEEEGIEGRADEAQVSELLQGTKTVLSALYGPNSPQEKALDTGLVRAVDKGRGYDEHLYTQRHLLVGALRNVVAEIDAGFLGSLRGSITGEVLTDLLGLARESLGETGDGAKNVAAVLAAAAFEDTIRRLAKQEGIPEQHKLANVLTGLKDKGLVAGAQVGIAQSYLKFRNNAMHAQWDGIERAGVESVLGFTEQLILKHFA